MTVWSLAAIHQDQVPVGVLSPLAREARYMCGLCDIEDCKSFRITKLQTEGDHFLGPSPYSVQEKEQKCREGNSFYTALHQQSWN